MTERVDFYVLNTVVDKQRWLVACRLAEKAYLKDLRVVVLLDSVAEAQVLDDLLWTFDERSFVPHRLCRESGAPAPVEVTAAPEGAPAADLLVNLRSGPAEMALRYPRIAEIVDAQAQRRRHGRERFKFYRELKIPLETHQLDETFSV